MSDFDQKLAQHISGLSKEQQPERDLWRGIELGIASQQREASNEESSSSTVTSRQWTAIAASVCVVTVLWFAAPFAFNADESRSDGYALIDAMSMQQQQQVNSLLASYQSTPALTQDWQEQLKELDDAADVIKAALKDDPDNSALIKMLHHVYQQQIALIERVHAPKWQQI
ncbi:hypothetical protein BM523_17110 [Alteromonas mediterranea]|uniref:hypothetical protein n=1 Tax=Alteromonas mediterranea TaxID=314275 RepID=UPI000903CE1D|nr:hypothetical protein [Alteromonas mediterranea]APD95577.1 hypothetical protein BM523_17110 [Alteromonas mediterranea]APD99211.1 hypothetical protein BM525_17130 [Alteromonas mediterranea]APE03462.1 hypothetical protein BM526_17315 [Alteromonas mediterranea]QDG36453.1 hypothetical protein FJN13_17225 [Alteromonas mediterranea]QGX63476.1 hypothetical protein FJN15_17570 [Alteromonas mediterranea]